MVVRFTPAKIVVASMAESLIGVGDPSVTNTNSITFGGTCLSNMGSVKVSGFDSTSVPCSSGNWSYTVSTQTSDAARSFRFYQEDSKTISSVSRQWTRDTTGPVISSFQLRAGVPTTINLFTPANFAAVDASAVVSAYCLVLKNATRPLTNDPCWRSNLDPDKIFSLASAQVRLDFDVGVGQTVYLWLRDRLGNVSGTTSMITYSAATPPTIGKFDAVNSDFLGFSAPTFSDTTFPLNQNVYIKWNTSDLAPGSISTIKLQYTVDEQTWVNIPGAAALTNTQGAGCTNGSMYTGCFVWSNASPATYFRVRMIAADNELATTVASSLFLNNIKVRLLAGRLDSGYGTHASSNIFNVKTSPSFMDSRRTLAVNTEGTMYLLVNEGVLRIQATTGISELWIKETGSTSGDGADAGSATLRGTYHIDLDAQDNLYIYDLNRIRKVSRATGIITTLIGGGADNTDSVVGGQNFLIDQVLVRSEFTVMSNGDIIFTSIAPEGTGPTFKSNRYYTAATDTITTIHYNVTGARSGSTVNAGVDITTQVSGQSGTLYDPLTNEVKLLMIISRAGGKLWYSLADPTGAGAAPDSIPTNYGCSKYDPNGLTTLKDGQIYSNCKSKVYRFDPATKGWALLIGTGRNGICPDGTDALICNLNTISIFKTYNGYTYLVDNGLIRTIDSLGKIRTVYGQAPFFGDGGSPLQARFGNVDYFGVNKKTPGDYKIQTNDISYIGIREFDLSGTLISKIAGAGDAAGTTAVVGAGRLTSFGNEWSGGFKNYVMTDPTTGDPLIIQKEFGDGILKANLTTNLWDRVAGGGGGDVLAAADGTLGNTLDLAALDFPTPIGYNGSSVIMKFSNYGNPIDHKVKIFDQSNGAISHLMGALGNSSLYIPNDCATKVLCDPEVLRGLSQIAGQLTYDSYSSTWLGVFEDQRNIIRRFTITGIPKKITAISTVAILSSSITGALAVHHDASNDYMYFIKNSDGKLYQRSGAGVETLLDFEIPGMLIKSENIEYVQNGPDKMLVFIFDFDGRKGFAAYML